MNYAEYLESFYQDERKSEIAPIKNKLAFLGSYIFDFITDSCHMDEILAGKMIEVIDIVLNETILEYIKDENNHLNYVTMANMPFLKNKLEWGTSIRGAWFETTDFSNDEPYIIGSADGLEVPKAELTTFFQEMIEWSRTP